MRATILIASALLLPLVSCAILPPFSDEAGQEAYLPAARPPAQVVTRNTTLTPLNFTSFSANTQSNSRVHCPNRFFVSELEDSTIYYLYQFDGAQRIPPSIHDLKHDIECFDYLLQQDTAITISTSSSDIFRASAYCSPYKPQLVQWVIRLQGMKICELTKWNDKELALRRLLFAAIWFRNERVISHLMRHNVYGKEHLAVAVDMNMEGVFFELLAQMESNDEPVQQMLNFQDDKDMLHLAILSRYSNSEFPSDMLLDKLLEYLPLRDNHVGLAASKPNSRTLSYLIHRVFQSRIPLSEINRMLVQSLQYAVKSTESENLELLSDFITDFSLISESEWREIVRNALQSSAFMEKMNIISRHVPIPIHSSDIKFALQIQSSPDIVQWLINNSAYSADEVTEALQKLV